MILWPVLSSFRFLLALCLVAVLSGVQAVAQTEMRLVRHPALSPDGLTLAVDWGGDLWIGSSYGGRMRRLTSSSARDTRPVFSPDGNSLAFISNRSGSYQVYRMPVEGGTPTQLTFQTQGARIEDWTPDGKRLLISAERDHLWTNRRRLFLISATEPSQEQLLFDANARNGCFSACGKKLLFAREGVDWWRHAYRGSDSGQVWIYDLDQKTFQRMSSEGAAARWPHWLPSSDEADESATEQPVLITSNESGYFNLALLGRDGKATPLTDYDDESAVFPTVAREQSVVVFRKGFDLYRYDLERDEQPQPVRLFCQEDLARDDQIRRVLRKATEVAFSSDGLEIAFVAGGDLWVMDTVLREPRQITRTAVAERSPSFSPDDQTIVYVSDQGGQTDLWTARREDSNKYWWQNRHFDLQQLTDDDSTESNPKWSPAGSQLAFMRSFRELWVKDLDTEDEAKIDTVTSSLDYDWSPDGNWLCYSAKDANYNAEIYIAFVEGTFRPINISQHFRDDYDPRWSPDGSMIAYTGYRENNTRDIFVVSLDGRNWRSRSRLMRMDAALQAMQRTRDKVNDDIPSNDPSTLLASSTEDKASNTDESSDPLHSSSATMPTFSSFDKPSWPERTERIRTPDSHEYRILWSPDSKSLVYTSRSQDRVDTYRLDIEDPNHQELLTRDVGRESRWLEHDDLVVWRSNGLPASVTKSGKVTEYDFKAFQRIDRAEFYGAVFDECWQTIRDRFYDPSLNGADWPAIRDCYGGMAREAVDEFSLADVIKMMLGKLNASHLGFSLTNSHRGDADHWNERTVHIGVRYRLANDGQSLIITEVLPGSPADIWDSKINVGEAIVSVNDRSLSSVACPVQLFNQPSYDPLAIVVEGKNGSRRTVDVTPVTSSTIDTLRYMQWTRQKSDFVTEQSNGQLAYLHVRRMMKDSQRQFERDLYDAATTNKTGLIVDVRDNRGGNIADHLLTMLSPGRHASTFRRGGELGYPQSRKPLVTWDKPLVVLCNQNSFSNAEIFCHGIKTLGRGTLIGTPTSGGVISTYDTNVRGIGRLRIPHRGWQVYTTGQNMDQVGATPDIRVDLDLHDIVAGRDVQLERAIVELVSQVDTSSQHASEQSE